MGMYREMEKPWFKNVVRKTIGWYRNNFFGSIRHQITLENGNLVYFPTFLYFGFLSQRKQAIFNEKSLFWPFPSHFSAKVDDYWHQSIVST